MKMKLTIGKRVVLGFAAVLAITAVLGALAYTRLVAIDVLSNRIVKDALPGLHLSGEIDASAREGFAAVAKQVMSDNPDEMQRLEAEIASSSTTVDGLMKE